ncbi:MAG: GNAT family N-acetyltransferase [Nitrospirae bacterium]|nr:GNAT family N-acetyltransferase [Nitrospirota bacterium]
MICIPVTDKDDPQWQNLVIKSVNGTFYHSLGYVYVYASKVSEVVCFAFKGADAMVAVISGGIVYSNGTTEFRSHFSSSFSGFCYSLPLKLKDACSVLDLLMITLKDKGVDRIVIQQPPAIYYRQVDEIMEHAMFTSGFVVDNVELTYYLNADFHPVHSVERNLRKAEKMQLSFCQTTDVSMVWKFLYEHKTIKGFYMSVSQEELNLLYGLFPGKIRLFAVYRQEEILAAIIVYCLNDLTVLGFAWAHDQRYQHLRPVDYLLYNTARTLFSEGIRYFDLGTVTIQGQPQWGVTRFKENYQPASALRKCFALRP